MEALKDIPPDNSSVLSEEDKNVLSRYFGHETVGRVAAEETPKKSFNWTFVAYVVILFVLLSNTYLDGFLDRLSFFEERPLIIFASKVGAFALLFMILYYLYR